MSALLNPFGFGGKTLLEMITENGLAANLALCLDAGDGASYNGSSQVWTDVSGGNQHFNRGASSGAEASDPTFSGVAGNRSENEYFSVDGGDYFSEASALTFAESWHKDNAAFTFGFVMYADLNDNQANPTTTPLFQNCSPALGVGISLSFSGVSDGFFLYVDSGGGAAINTFVEPAFLPASRQWICDIFSMDEAAGNILSKSSSAAADLLTGKTYSSPSGLDSERAYTLLAGSDGSWPWASGVRLAMVFAWNRVLSSGELDTIYAAIKQRFPTLG